MPILFSPIQLAQSECPNRILTARGPVHAAREHVPTPIMVDYYAQRASAGLIISETIGVSRQGLGWPNAIVLWIAEQVAGWRSPFPDVSSGP